MNLQRSAHARGGRHRAAVNQTFAIAAVLALICSGILITLRSTSPAAARPGVASPDVEAAAARHEDRPSGPYGIWPDTARPTVTADPEARWVQLGVRFRSSSAGWVTAIRFYKSIQNVGPHTGYLWTADGRTLATATFGHESATGWQTATLGRPVRISANTDYVASYVAPHGRYADDQWAMSPQKPITRFGLTAIGSSYTYGHGLPMANWRHSNYYVDILFTTDIAGAGPGTAGSTRPSTTGSRSTSTSAVTSPSSAPTRSSTAQRSTSKPAAPTSTRTAPSTSRATSSSTPVRSTTSRPTPSTSTAHTTAATTRPTTSSRPSTTASATSPPTSRPTSAPTTTSRSTTTPPVAGHVTLNCAPRPSACGYPDSSNTGVPAGTALKAVPGDITSGRGWHYDSRGWIAVDGDGAVVSGISTTASLDVTANNVTIANSRIVVRGEGWGIAARHTSNLVIKNNEIAGPVNSGSGRLMVGIKDIYGDSTGMQVISNDIWNTSTGVQIEAGLIQGNYIHDLGYTAGDHLNGTTSNGGSRPLTIRHNTIFNKYDQTDAVSLFQDFGVQANRVIDNNLLAGGGYTIYAGANPGKESSATNITVTNNRISRMYFPNGGSYGPDTAYYPGGGNIWSGNVWDDTGAAIRY